MSQDIDRMLMRLFAESQPQSGSTEAFVARVAGRIRRRRAVRTAFAVCGGVVMAAALLLLSPMMIHAAARIAHLPSVLMQQDVPLLAYPAQLVAYFVVGVVVLSRAIAR